MNVSTAMDKEAKRLQLLQQTGLLDTAAELRFDRITRLAAAFFKVEICLISLVDEERQWFKSKVGLDVCETARGIAFCHHTIKQSAIFVVEDATQDPKFQDNPLVTEAPFIRFYAGAPLLIANEQAIGTLCLIDPHPRQFSVQEQEALRDFADLVQREIVQIDQIQAQKNQEIKRLSEVARQTTNGVVMTDPLGLVVWVNEAFSNISGYSLAEMQGQKPGSLLQGPETDPACINLMRTALQQQQPFTVEVLNYAKDFRPYWIRIACNPMWDEHGALSGYIAIETDITRQKHDEEQLQHSDNLLKAVIDANSIGTWRLNLITGELLVNDKWAALLGYSMAELMPGTRETWERLTHPDDVAYCLTLLAKHAEGKTPIFEANIRMLHQNGEWIWINSRARISAWTDEGKAEWVLGTHFDINDQIRAEHSLDEKSQQMSAIVENMLDGLICVNQQGLVQTFNRAAEYIFGYSSDEVIDRDIRILLRQTETNTQSDHLSQILKSGVTRSQGMQELTAVRKEGSVFPIELGVVAVNISNQTHYICIVRDITQRKKHDAEIHQLAFYDVLTRLPNRRLFLERLQYCISQTEKQNQYAALLFIDLDKFKDLNDSSGHNKGDLLLCQVASRLLKEIKTVDLIARMGGDEFVVLAHELGQSEPVAAEQAQVLARNVIKAITQEYDLDGLSYNITASIGVTLFNDAKLSKEDLLKQADMAMYKAKDAGRNGIKFFDPQMQIAVSSRARLVTDLYEAIQEQQFQLFYQPQVDLTGRVVGYEALLRWLHPTKGYISPAQFIPLAEETGLIVPIGEWVLYQACKQLGYWSTTETHSELTLAVNISAVQFTRQDIVHTVLAALGSTQASAHLLKLEITESVLASNVPDVKQKMARLCQHGISFSIDDFGTGYSSLSYLKQLPINQLKIDQSFVRDIIQNPNDRAIAQAVITLAASLHLQVIAEGVETQAQRDLLESMGCTTFQGYLFGKPSPMPAVFLS